MLPAPKWLLDNIADASKNTAKIYLLYMGFLAYSALTVVSTTDKQLILNNATAHLPFINVDVSLIGFFITAPVLAIIIFIYFQLYLIRVRRLICDLRLNYDKIEARRIYPWLLNFPEDQEDGILGIVQWLFVRLSIWSLPGVLFLFSLWILKKHKETLSYGLSLLPFLGIIVVILFWREHEKISARYKNKPGKSYWCIITRKGFYGLATIILIYTIFLIQILIPATLEGKYFRVNLSNQLLVTKPETDYKDLYWADLSEAHLEGAILESTILKRADLRGSHLQGADISRGNLEGADLGPLYENNKIINITNLEGATLKNANLENADLGSANLENAFLYTANLKGANLKGTQNLMVEQLCSAKTLYQTKMDIELLSQVETTCPKLLDEPVRKEVKTPAAKK